MTLEMSECEAGILGTILSRFIAETKSEIYHTEAASYKNILKQQQEETKRLRGERRDGNRSGRRGRRAPVSR